MRALNLPQKDYEVLEKKYKFQELLDRWSREYEATFSEYNCTYNGHVFNHLLKVRALGPLSDNSAFPFEDHYAVVKKNYRVGTKSIGKQAISNGLLALKSGHACNKRIFIGKHETRKVNDGIVFMEDGKLVTIVSSDERRLEGKTVAVQNGYFPLMGLNFNDVLVFKKDERKNAKTEHVTYDLSLVRGKCIVVGTVISVYTRNMMTE